MIIAKIKFSPAKKSQYVQSFPLFIIGRKKRKDSTFTDIL